MFQLQLLALFLNKILWGGTYPPHYLLFPQRPVDTSKIKWKPLLSKRFY